MYVLNAYLGALRAATSEMLDIVGGAVVMVRTLRRCPGAPSGGEGQRNGESLGSVSFAHSTTRRD